MLEYFPVSCLFMLLAQKGIVRVGERPDLVVVNTSIAQKRCVRILFGDLDTYLDKQSTCPVQDHLTIKN